jgi:hypothetical protein
MAEREQAFRASRFVDNRHVKHPNKSVEAAPSVGYTR